jgi:hypothetical protein
MTKKSSLPTWPALQELIENEGQVTLGYVHPIPCVAVASDAHNMIAAIKRKRGESLIDLLNRLDTAVALSEEDGSTVDEINN